MHLFDSDNLSIPLTFVDVAESTLANATLLIIRVKSDLKTRYSPMWNS